MKFFKKVLVGGGLAVAGFFGFKLYKIISNIAKLEKSLPEFLNNVYGEKPTLHINYDLKTATIKAGFSQAILDKHSDIESTIREYIEDFYPDLAKSTIKIEVFANPEASQQEEEKETEESEN